MHNFKHSDFMENDIEKKIIKILSRHAEGITIMDISREIGVHRNTVSKYIFGLVKQGTVKQRRIGVVSLCYLNEEVVKKIKRKGMAKISVLLFITTFFISVLFLLSATIADPSTSIKIDIYNPSGGVAVNNASMSCGSQTCGSLGTTDGTCGSTSDSSANRSTITCTYSYNSCAQVGYYTAKIFKTHTGTNCYDVSIDNSQGGYGHTGCVPAGCALDTCSATNERYGSVNIYECLVNGASGCNQAGKKCLDTSICCPDLKCKGDCCDDKDCSKGYSCNATKYCIVTDTTPPQWSNNITSPSAPTEYQATKTYKFNIIWTDATTSVGTVYFQWTNSSGSYNETPAKDGNVYYVIKTNLSPYEYRYRWYANDLASNWASTTLMNYEVRKSPNTTMAIVVYNPSGQVVVNNASMSCVNNSITTCGDSGSTGGTCGGSSDSSANRSTMSCTYAYSTCAAVGNYTAIVYSSHTGFNCYDASIDNTQGGWGHTGCTPNLCPLDTCSQNERFPTYGNKSLYQCGANGSTCNNADLKCLDVSTCCADGKCKGNCCVNANCPTGLCNSTKYCVAADYTPPLWSNNLTSPSAPTEYQAIKTYRLNITWTDTTTSIANVSFQWTNSSGTYNETLHLGQVSKDGNVYYVTKTNLAVYEYKYKWYAKDSADNWNSTSVMNYPVRQVSNTTMKITIYNQSGQTVVNNASMTCPLSGITSCGFNGSTGGTCGSNSDTSANRSQINCTYPFSFQGCAAVGNYTAKVYLFHTGFNCYDASIDNTQGGSGHTGCTPNNCSLDTCSREELINTTLYKCVAAGGTCNDTLNLKCLDTSVCCGDLKCKGDCCSDTDCPAGYWCNSTKYCTRFKEPFECEQDAACPNPSDYKIKLYAKTSSTEGCLIKHCCGGASLTCTYTIGTCYQTGSYYGEANTSQGAQFLSSSGWVNLFNITESMNPCPVGTVGYGPNVACGIDGNYTEDRMAYWSAVTRGTIKNICFHGVSPSENISYYIRENATTGNMYTGNVTFKEGWTCHNVSLPWNYDSLALGKTSGRVSYSTVTTGGNSYNGATAESGVDRWHAVCIERNKTSCGNKINETGENCVNCPDDAGCLENEICNTTDGTCGPRPPGKCNFNTTCDYNESCDCDDCWEKQDGCILGDICSSITKKCACKTTADGLCTLDPNCKDVDPDCVECICGNWYDTGCGIDDCNPSESKQVRECSPVGCDLVVKEGCVPAKVCLSYYHYSADVKYFNVFWNAYYPPSDSNPNRPISIACIFNCDNRTQDCVDAQKCSVPTVNQLPGPGSCSVINPEYKYGMVKDKIICRVFDPSDPTKEAWY